MQENLEDLEAFAGKLEGILLAGEELVTLSVAEQRELIAWWYERGCTVSEYEEIADELVKVCKAFAGMFDGELHNVGGETLVMPSIKVQLFRDAKAAIAKWERRYV